MCLGRIPIPGGEGDLDADLRFGFGFGFGAGPDPGSGLGCGLVGFDFPPMTPNFPGRFSLGCWNACCGGGDADFVGSSGGVIGEDGAGGGVGSLGDFFLPPIVPSPPPRDFFCCVSFSLGLGGDGGGGDGDSGRWSS